MKIVPEGNLFEPQDFKHLARDGLVSFTFRLPPGHELMDTPFTASYTDAFGRFTSKPGMLYFDRSKREPSVRMEILHPEQKPSGTA
ncbi:hypothetical protein [Variovorax sp. JS1663]|uniref:hypothetical protein n=1 Tax=Variovorax sp. JS1663 TaxID=1851577 RepID=UPI0013020FD0|nr:hypothetical protein [Variovorax sp. JS1663]